MAPRPAILDRGSGIGDHPEVRSTRALLALVLTVVLIARTGRSHTDGRTRRRDGERGDGGRGGGRARGPCPGPRYRRAGGGAGTRSGERGAAGSARSCAIPPQ